MARPTRNLVLALLAPLAAAALAAPWPVPEPPVRAGGQDEARPGSFVPGSVQRRRELERGLVGLWKLRRFVHPERPPGDGDVIGALHVATDVMSLVLHARRQQPFAPDADFFVQAGLFHWRIDEVGRLHASTIIGHNDLTGRVVFETAFQPREFELRLEVDALVMTRPDGAVLEFDRVQETEFPQAAIDRLQEVRARRGAIAPEPPR